MKSKTHYNHTELEKIVRETRLEFTVLAARVGVKRNQIYKAIKGEQASVGLIQRIVDVANEQVNPPIPYDWRTLLLPSPEPAKKFASNVS